MLTFLRKIRQSFIDSGNSKKYLLYAIGEIVLVMIGIKTQARPVSLKGAYPLNDFDSVEYQILDFLRAATL